MFETFLEMFSYPFITRAIIGGLFVSICASLLGVTLVLKRFSLIGQGLSSLSFGALSIAAAFNFAPLEVALPLVVLASLALLRLTENSKLKADAAVALISSGSLAIGVMILSVTTGMNTDVCNYLFGSILGLVKSEVYLSIGLSLVVILVFIFFYRYIFAVIFDETFAQTSGIKVSYINACIAILSALTIVLGMRLMGSLLITSLIVLPALSAIALCRNFKLTIIVATIISMICFMIGMYLSYVYATPSGASITIVNIIVYLLVSLLKLKGN